MSESPDSVDAFIEQLAAGTAQSRLVQHQNGTSSAKPHLTDNSEARPAFDNYTNRVDALFADQPAYQAILKESPRHRLILWMTAQGHSPQQVADALGITKQTVYNVRKQPWFRTMFVRLTSELGKDSVHQLLKGEVLPSIQTLIEIRDNGTKDADRRAAADSLLDRFLGKPTVKVDSDAKAPSDVPAEVAQLQAEAARLTAELSAAGVSTNFTPSTS